MEIMPIKLTDEQRKRLLLNNLPVGSGVAQTALIGAQMLMPTQETTETTGSTGTTGGSGGSGGVSTGGFTQARNALNAILKRQMGDYQGRFKTNYDIIEQQRQQAKESAQKRAQQAYINYMMQQKGLDEYVGRNGLMGGETETSKLRMGNNYQNTLNEVNSGLDDAIMQYDNQFSKTKNEEAEALNDLQNQYEQALLNLRQRFNYWR